MNEFNRASDDIAKTRKAMNGFIGEIITTVIGQDTLQKIFEEPEHNQEWIKLNQENTPSGVIALKLGIVNQDVKNALLVAQAAERTALNAERTEVVMKGAKPESDWPLSFTSDTFKYVGSERDPKSLQESQATWQVSQIVLCHTNHYAHGEKDGSVNAGCYIVPRQELVDSLKKASAHYYTVAANTLAENGFGEAATKLKSVAASVLPVNHREITVTPHDIAAEFEFTEQSYIKDMYIVLGSDHYTNDDLVKLGQKLKDLTIGQKAEAAPQPKGPANTL